MRFRKKLALVAQAGLLARVHFPGYDHLPGARRSADDAAWIRFKVTEELQAVISRCRDDVVSPYLIHRRTDRKKQKQTQTKDHRTQVEERYLTRAFKEAPKVAGCYKGWEEEEMPGFHEVRALSLHLYQKAGKDG